MSGMVGKETDDMSNPTACKSGGRRFRFGSSLENSIRDVPMPVDVIGEEIFYNSLTFLCILSLDHKFKILTNKINWH